MGISFRSDEHAPKHYLGEEEELKWVKKRYLPEKLIGNKVETIQLSRPERSTGNPEYDKLLRSLKPFSPDVPCLFVSRSKEGFTIDFTVNTDIHPENAMGFDLEIIFQPIRDYNHTEIIGAHIIFVDPDGHGKLVNRYCDRFESGEFIQDLFTYVEQYLLIHGDVNFT